MTTSPTQTSAPLQMLQPVADERNLLNAQDDDGSCCGGTCHTG